MQMNRSPTRDEPSSRSRSWRHSIQSRASRALLGVARALLRDSTRTRRSGCVVSTVHVGESPEEVEFLKKAPVRGARCSKSSACGMSLAGTAVVPGGVLSDIGFLDATVIVVRGVQLEGTDLDRLRALGVTLASCPRSNRYVGVGSPPLEVFYAMDVEVAFGTDSLASVEDLNMFAELAEARRIAPKVSARALLRSATLAGATALGFGDHFGSIEPGKRAAPRRARA